MLMLLQIYLILIIQYGIIKITLANNGCNSLLHYEIMA